MRKGLKTTGLPAIVKATKTMAKKALRKVMKEQIEEIMMAVNEDLWRKGAGI